MLFAFSWWPGQESGVYHTQTRLPGYREGLLIDIGAFDNLMGDHWLKSVTKYATNAGHKTFVEDQPGLNSVSGVGGSSNAVRTKATLPIGVSELGNLLFRGSVLDNSDVPALLGLRTIANLHGIIDTRMSQRKMYI
eukprot:9126222-Prorocentrum_lima.AAC.1